MRIIWLIAALLLGGGSVLAQPSLLRTYATQRVHARLMAAHPDMVEKRVAQEALSEDFRALKAVKKVTVPVVFHILYTPGQAYPAEAQVFAQLAALNRDFDRAEKTARHPADTLEGFLKAAAKMDIDFCLPELGPDGRPAAAIRYLPTSRGGWTDDDAVKSARLGGVDPWDPGRYLNVWVAALADSVSGYAQMPGGPAATDGIVIDYRFFGPGPTALPPYDQGKTLAHLVAGYLNVFELWNESVECGDDYVDDTPIHNAPNHSRPAYRHISTCGDNPVEMTMNFMDNTDDTVQYLFTYGQKLRMQAVLAEGGLRAGLTGEKTKCAKEEKPKLTLPAPEGMTEAGEPVVSLFPNPTREALTLEVTLPQAGPFAVGVFNTLGALVYSSVHTGEGGLQQVAIDCRRWGEGIYFVQVVAGAHRITRRVAVSPP